MVVQLVSTALSRFPSLVIQCRLAEKLARTKKSTDITKDPVKSMETTGQIRYKQ
jgi:hypothetical protein